MKSKIIVLLLCMFLLAGCGKVEEPPVTAPSIIETAEPTSPKTDEVEVTDSITGTGNVGDIIPTENEKVEFIVSLVFDGEFVIPEEEVIVIWEDGHSQNTATIGEDGYARIYLDGEFNVYLGNVPKLDKFDYTYNPNIYKADNDNPVVVIELERIVIITSRYNGKALYNELPITNEGTYRAKIESSSKKMFYEFKPTVAGYYVIESLINIHEDVINPTIDTYNGTFAAKFKDETIDGGGYYKKGGFTKNFRWVVRLSQSEIQNVFTFSVYGTSKTGVYPINIDFSVTYTGEYYPEDIVSTYITAEQANFKTDEYDKSVYKFVNSDHGTGSYYGGVSNGTGILKGTEYKFNDATGYWHRYYAETDTYGPILCAKIAAPCAYYERALNYIEEAGNKNLTVSNGTENYKRFIEVDYTLACNSDGVCYVTQELKEFLQKFSISQRLFFDGNGFVETTGVYAIEDDQWLFACGYYTEK